MNSPSYQYIGSKSEQIGCSQSCKQKCRTHCSASKSYHSVQNYQELAQRLNQIIYIGAQSTMIQWNMIEEKINQHIDKIKKEIENVRKIANQQFYNSKIAAFFSLKDKTIAKNIRKLIDKNMDDLTCSDIYFIQNSIDNATIIDKKIVLDTQIDIYKIINQQITKINFHVKIPSKPSPQLNTIRPEKPIQPKNKINEPIKNNLVNNYQDKFQKLLLNLLVPSSDSSFNYPPTVINNPSIALQSPAKFKKVKEVQNYNVNTQFDIVIKVMRLIKDVYIDGEIHLKFVGGDETGYADCVFIKSNIISENAVIKATNCKVFPHKNIFKQIQTNKNSNLTLLNIDLDSSKCNFNLSHHNLPLKDYQKRTQPKEQNVFYEYINSLQKQKSAPQQLQKKRILQNKNPKIQTSGCIKIQSLQPFFQNIKLIAEIIKVKSQINNTIECMIGDDTGVIKAYLPILLAKREGSTFLIENALCELQNKKLVLRSAKISEYNGNYLRIENSNNMSRFDYN